MCVLFFTAHSSSGMFLSRARLMLVSRIDDVHYACIRFFLLSHSFWGVRAAIAADVAWTSTDTCNFVSSDWSPGGRVGEDPGNKVVMRALPMLYHAVQFNSLSNTPPSTAYQSSKRLFACHYSVCPAVWPVKCQMTDDPTSIVSHFQFIWIVIQ